MNDTNGEKTTVEGMVLEKLPDTLFKVEIKDKGETSQILAYLAGNMKKNKIRVDIHDRVQVEIDKYVKQGGRGRIIRRG